MTTTRYFEVKVTGCYECKHVRGKGSEWAYCSVAESIKRIKTFKENFDQLTPSCPMWNETKESETK